MQSIPSSSLQSLDLSPEPDLHPLYPSTAYIAVLLSSHSGLTPDQKAELVAHCLARSCVFGELSVLQYLLSDPHAQSYVDLGIRDEDGQGLISLAIHGFGAESERDVEREECVRLLIAQGTDMSPDKSGWTPLHHAVLLSPPTLVSHLMTHGCSPFDVTRRNLTPLDIVTAHSVIPGRDDVALLLEEAMRGEGWTGGRMEENRHLFDERAKRKGKQKHVQEHVGRVLGVHSKWWARDSDGSSSDSDDDGDEDLEDETLFTPPVDYSSMLVFSPLALPLIFDSLITNFQPSFRDSTPANTLYMLARFACLTCDHTWLEDLIIGATDCIEETFFNKPEDVTCLVFWLYNTTLWLHLMQCDNSINEACEMLGSFEIIEEVINSVFVFIIRFAERRVDHFESEWSVLRALGMKKSQPVMNSSASRSSPASPPSPSPHRPSSPTPYGTMSSSTSKARNPGSTTPLQSLFPDAPPPPSPADLTSFLTALHTLLILSDINPALTTQLWSQVMYWTSCEMFNRILTRKKYLCRSKAVQIGMNLSSVEEWVGQMGLPRGVQTHFTPVRELLNWLQCLSSITEFPNLVATIQTMKCLNPLQMKRAVRDYKYEVNEGRMTDECVQYLTQLQKDWERHRVKLGVEALRKEMGERERERDESLSSSLNDLDQSVHSVSFSSDSSELPPNQNIDVLFDKDDRIASWEPPKPPQVLGELLDSRHMLPLLFPSNPRMLAAVSRPLSFPDDGKMKRPNSVLTSDSRSDSSATMESRCTWRARHRKVRQVGIGTLKWVDGVRSASRWGRLIPDDEDIESSEEKGETELRVKTHVTPLTRKPTKGRASHGGDTTPIER
ncbi:DIL domain-containing protein [Desarmillaria tabescens]|uniref:DIL domain-containing protein n=1 Tax=Armillaria tabescens TaxID=1929756 RepID=A0AA39T4X8_ARMTA|nr:DIL domain-containing protein [Desarmillaria tabescens]KAK0464906.1 DIL domain-containing protein [Desarmillaria tabescens]